LRSGRRQEGRGRRQEAGGRRQEGRGRRQEAGGRRQEAGGKRVLSLFIFFGFILPTYLFIKTD
jgi:hypothetical protein